MCWPEYDLSQLTYSLQFKSVTYSGNSYSVEHFGEGYLFSMCYQIVNRFFECINHLGLSYCFCPEIYIFIFCTVTHEVTQHVMFAVSINIWFIFL